MSTNSPNPWTVNRGYGASVDFDLGLRQYMLRVYNYMASGLALTGLVAWFAASSGLYASIAHSGLIWLVMLLSFRLQSMSLGAAQASFWVYSALMGLSLSAIFLIYTHTSIAEVFFITAGTFLSMSLYGYTTKRDLTGLGSFMMMGLWGIIIAGFVNMFIGSSQLHFITSIIGVIVFTGLTAYDTQKIRDLYFASDRDGTGKVAIMGALNLYLDFINLFLLLMQFLGTRRD